MVRYSLSGRTVFCHALAGVDGLAVHSYVYAPVLCDETTVSALDKIVNRRAHVWKFTFLHRDLDAPRSTIDATCPFPQIWARAWLYTSSWSSWSRVVFSTGSESYRV
jgi:hypothetical protein